VSQAAAAAELWHTPALILLLLLLLLLVSLLARAGPGCRDSFANAAGMLTARCIFYWQPC
jgi:hypothetical protein